MITAGNLAQADSTLLTTLVSIDPVYVDFQSDEQTYLRYNQQAHGKGSAARDPVRVGLGNEDGYPHTGTVDFIDNQVDPATGTIHARAVLANPDRLLTPGLLKLSAYSPDFGEAEEQVELEYTGEEMTIGFNSRYVLDALGAQGGEQIVLEVKDGLSPGVIKSLDDEGSLCVIMPMRI